MTLPQSRSRLDSVLDDIEEYLQDREDVRDGSDGQQLPNREMSLLTDLRYARSYAPSETAFIAVGTLHAHKDRPLHVTLDTSVQLPDAPEMLIYVAEGKRV